MQKERERERENEKHPKIFEAFVATTPQLTPAESRTKQQLEGIYSSKFVGSVDVPIHSPSLRSAPIGKGQLRGVDPTWVQILVHSMQINPRIPFPVGILSLRGKHPSPIRHPSPISHPTFL